MFMDFFGNLFGSKKRLKELQNSFDEYICLSFCVDLDRFI